MLFLSCDTDRRYKAIVQRPDGPQCSSFAVAATLHHLALMLLNVGLGLKIVGGNV